MALRSGWRFAAGAAAPRLLRGSGALRPGAPVPGGGSSASSLDDTHRRRKTTTESLRCRRFASAPPSTDVTYEQLKRLLAERTAVVVDVREPWELREYGVIPGSINIPLGQVIDALQLGPDEFKEKYGGEMPEPTDNIVFTCLAGFRSKSALTAAASLGYTRVLQYPGGWKDWSTNEQQG